MQNDWGYSYGLFESGEALLLPFGEVWRTHSPVRPLKVSAINPNWSTSNRKNSGRGGGLLLTFSDYSSVIDLQLIFQLCNMI